MTATTLTSVNERGRELFPGILASLIVAARALGF